MFINFFYYSILKIDFITVGLVWNYYSGTVLEEKLLKLHPGLFR
jgi:hypothetical protein